MITEDLQEVKEALEDAERAILGLADQQAMADEWYMPILHRVRDALRLF